MAFDVKRYLEKALLELSTESYDTWGNEKSNILCGLAMLYKNTEDENNKELLIKSLTDAKDAKWAAIGNCYAYALTKEDTYKNRMCVAMEQLKSEFDTTEDEMAYVFYMKYETTVGGKEHYQDVVNRISKAAGREDKDVAYCMTALIESLESVDQMIYEHYHVIKTLFKKSLAQALEMEEMDSTQMALIGYSILKACRMRAILSEKYEEIGMELVDAALEASESADMDMGACLMAYAEKTLHN